jgi:peptidoglycan-associated lipoprotein
MKQILFVFILSLGFSFYSLAQTFELNGSVFHEGDILQKNILFEYDKSTIQFQYIPFLDSLASFLKEHKKLSLEVSNHCDERWSKEYSTCLTCKRAQEIVNYLISKGIDKNRLTAKGYNAEKPIVIHAKTEEEHQVNRRTEFKILRTDYSF